MIKFRCEQCDKTVGAETVHAGRQVRCPACHQPTQVPALERGMELALTEPVSSAAGFAASERSASASALATGAANSGPDAANPPPPPKSSAASVNGVLVLDAAVAEALREVVEEAQDAGVRVEKVEWQEGVVGLVVPHERTAHSVKLQARPMPGGRTELRIRVSERRGKRQARREVAARVTHAIQQGDFRVLIADHVFCPDTVTRERDAAAAKPSAGKPKSLVMAYLLWCFLGLVGGHRFYLGRRRGGMVMLGLTLGAISLTVGLVGLGVAAAPPLLVLAPVGLALLVVPGGWALIDAFLIPGYAHQHNGRLAEKSR